MTVLATGFETGLMDALGTRFLPEGGMPALRRRGAAGGGGGRRRTPSHKKSGFLKRLQAADTPPRVSGRRTSRFLREGLMDACNGYFAARSPPGPPKEGMRAEPVLEHDQEEWRVKLRPGDFERARPNRRGAGWRRRRGRDDFGRPRRRAGLGGKLKARACACGAHNNILSNRRQRSRLREGEHRKPLGRCNEDSRRNPSRESTPSSSSSRYFRRGRVKSGRYPQRKSMRNTSGPPTHACTNP